MRRLPYPDVRGATRYPVAAGRGEPSASAGDLSLNPCALTATDSAADALAMTSLQSRSRARAHGALETSSRYEPDSPVANASR
jgi:hypothetical protein